MSSSLIEPAIEPDAPSRTEAAEPVHRLAEDTELIGQYQGSGLQEPKYLIKRSDGQVMQVPRLLFGVAAALDGVRTDDEVARELAGELGQELTGEQVSFLVEERLRPAGVIVARDGEGAAGTADGDERAASAVRADPLLALRYRVGVVSARVAWRIGGLFRPFFWRPVWIALLVGFLAVDFLILSQRQMVDRLTGGVTDIVRHPVLNLAIVGLTAVTLAFHECGHVTACRYGGARPGEMGVGIYLVWPAFYSTVTDSYRLGRAGRLRTDLGGVYFNAIAMLGVGAAYLDTGQGWLLILLISLHVETAWQFLPSIRLDGYYMLADLVGVPELFSFLRPVLVGLVPGRRSDPVVRQLRPWPRRIIVLWVALAIPTLLFYLVSFLVVLPTALPAAWASFLEDLRGVQDAAHAGQVAGAALGVFDVLLVLLPWAGSALIAWGFLSFFTRLAMRRWGLAGPSTAVRTRLRRGLALTVLGCLAAAVVARVVEVAASLPAGPDEGRLLDSAFAAVRGTASGAPSVGADEFLAREHVAAYAALTGAFGRHADVLEGGREVAIVATAVLAAALLVLAVRRRLRVLAVGAALTVALVLGGVTGIPAAAGPGLLGAVWVTVGLLLLLPGRHLRRLRPAVLIGVLAILVGVATEPLLALPLAVGTLVTRGAGWAERPASGHWAAPPGAAVVVSVPLALVAVASSGDGAPAGIGAPETVLLVLGAMVVAAGVALREARITAAATASLLLAAVVPWAGSGRAATLAFLAVVLLVAQVVNALQRRPAEQRPHPLLRAVVAVPVAVLVVVAAVLLPAPSSEVPHQALAAWLTGDSSPQGVVAVPAGLWGDLVRDGVPAGRLAVTGSREAWSAPWSVDAGTPGAGTSPTVAFGSGPGRLSVVMSPVARATAEMQARVQAAEAGAETADRGAVAALAAQQSLGALLAQSPRVNAPSSVTAAFAQGGVGPTALAFVARLSAQHGVTLGDFPAPAGPGAGPVQSLLVLAVDGRPAGRQDVSAFLADFLQAQGQPVAAAQVTPAATGLLIDWTTSGLSVTGGR